jgi:anti-sigma-K factor RskA
MEIVLECKEFKDQVLLYAAGALEPEEAEGVRRHLAGGCPSCAGELAQSQALLASMALTLPPAVVPPGARQRLLDRVSEQSLRIDRPAAGIPWWAQIALPSAIAASIAAAVTLFFSIRLQAKPPEAPALDGTVGILTAMVEQQQHELVALRASGGAQTVEWASDRNLKLIKLSGTANQPPDAGGNVFWDVDRGVWYFYAAKLKPAPPGKTYELWFVDAKGSMKLPAGSFNPNSDGHALLETPVPADAAPKVNFAAVTDEPAGSSMTSPTGNFQLTGGLQ